MNDFAQSVLDKHEQSLTSGIVHTLKTKIAPSVINDLTTSLKTSFKSAHAAAIEQQTSLIAE